MENFLAETQTPEAIQFRHEQAMALREMRKSVTKEQMQKYPYLIYR